MNCIKRQSERFTAAESWSPSPHVAYHPLRVSRSAAQSSLHSLDNSRFGNEHRSLPATGDFFALEDDDNDYLLENSHVPMDSTVQCVCKCGHEISFPRRSRSFHGYLPEADEEIGIPFLRDLHGSSRAAPLDEKFCYAYTRPESTLEFIYSNPSSIGLETSRGVSYFSTNADDDFQRLRLEEEILVNPSLSRCTLGQTRQSDERRMPLYATENLRCINQESSDIYNGGVSFDPMHSFSSLPYEGIQSPGYELQFRHRHGAFVPVRPKQAMSSSPLEVPSSSSVSVYSDETEHTGDHPQLKVGLYKTELCRSWEETGFCRYGAKCQACYYAVVNSRLSLLYSLRMETTISAQFLATLNIKRSCAGHSQILGFAVMANDVVSSTTLALQCKLYRGQVICNWRRPAQGDCPYFNSYAVSVRNTQDSPELLSSNQTLIFP